MNIKSLINKYKNGPIDSTLARNVEIKVSIVSVPEKIISNKYIILRDESGNLEAVTTKENVFKSLKNHLPKSTILKLKGHLDKTEYGNIAFEIEEIIE